MRLLATRKSRQTRAVLDPWTVVHFSAGLAAGLTRIPLRWVLAGAVAYEVVEQVLERKRIGQEAFNTSGPETTPNALMDVAVCVAGHRLGELWNTTGT